MVEVGGVQVSAEGSRENNLVKDILKVVPMFEALGEQV